MELLEFTMTGTKHSAAYNLHKGDIGAGDDLELEWDQGNQYDTDAIKVLWQGEHIGWVPKRLGEAKCMLRKLMGEFEIQVTVVSHEPENPTDMQLVAAVELIDWVDA